MIIIGAGGLAKQILDVVERLNSAPEVYFYDNVSKLKASPKLFNYSILQNIADLKLAYQKGNNRLVLAIGSPKKRQELFTVFKNYDMNFQTLVSSSALIGKNEVQMSEGVVLMEHVIVESSVSIGKGTLINTGAKIFHDSFIGDFCEIAPSCNILGKCKIGNGVFIGANATILPGIEIGANAVIGAGAVVTKNISQGALVKGIPGKIY